MGPPFRANKEYVQLYLVNSPLVLVKMPKSYIKCPKPSLPWEAVSRKLDNTNPAMKQPKSKLNRGLLDELNKYSALLIELYYIQASETVSQRTPYLLQLLQLSTVPNTRWLS